MTQIWGMRMHHTFSPVLRWGALVGLLALCFAVAGLGGAVTAGSVGTWYQTLAKPPFNPPDWVFGPVWTTLYILMAFAAWRAWERQYFRRDSPALWLFVGQLALNLAWSYIFFGARAIGPAAAEILLLWVAIALTLRCFWRLDRWAGLLFIPYLAWVSLAIALNLSIWWLN